MRGNFKVEPVEMVQIGQWYSWQGDADANPAGVGPGTPASDGGAGAGSPRYYGGPKGFQENVPAARDGGGRASHNAQAPAATPTEEHPRRSHPGGAPGVHGVPGGPSGPEAARGGRTFPRASGPYGGNTAGVRGAAGSPSGPEAPRDGQSGSAAGVKGLPGSPSGPAAERGARQAGVPYSGSLKQQRARFAKEMAEKPGLREKVLGISAGENLNPSANTSVMETMINRASMRGVPLENESRLHRSAPHFRAAPYQRGGRVAGYYAGYKPEALRRPAIRAMAEADLGKALEGSNVSNYATGNASGSFARNRIAKGIYGGGLRSLYNGEYFVGEGGKKQYFDWKNRTEAADKAAPIQP